MRSWLLTETACPLCLADKGTWPVVLITAPVDQSMGNQSNPFAYEVPQSPGNPVRALVFDKNPVVGVEFRIDEVGDWHEMEQGGAKG